MSYDFIIYMRSNRFPEVAQLAAELSSRAPWLVLPSSFDLRVARGYTPVGDAGFEVTRSSITAARIEGHKKALKEAGQDDDHHLSILLASDMRITFRCQDDQEISVARLVAGALATLSGGFLRDPQKDMTIKGSYLPA
jgi:hypothetical protein